MDARGLRLGLEDKEGTGFAELAFGLGGEWRDDGGHGDVGDGVFEVICFLVIVLVCVLVWVGSRGRRTIGAGRDPVRFLELIDMMIKYIRFRRRRCW